MEESQRTSEMLATLSTQRHQRELEHLSLKRQKIERSITAAQHQREREREAHQLSMLHLQLQIRDGRDSYGLSPNLLPPNPLPPNPLPNLPPNLILDHQDNGDNTFHGSMSLDGFGSL